MISAFMAVDGLGPVGGALARDSGDGQTSWRGALLQTALSVTAIAAIAATATTGWMFEGAVAVINMTVGSLVSALLGVAALRRRWAYNLRATVLVGAMYGVSTLAIAVSGYDPGAVLIGLWCVTLAGVLLGRRALYSVGGLLIATILVVGALQSHHPTLSAAADFAPRRLQVWLRVALIYAIVVGVMSVTLRSAVAHIERAFADYARSARLVGEALQAEEHARAERLATERELQDSQKLEAVGHLAAGLAHELNNALTVIQLAAEKLRVDAPGTEESSRSVAEISDAWKRATGVTRELLDLSRREPESIEPVDAGQAVRDSEAALRNVLPEDVGLHIDVGCAAPVVADVGRLRQALINLVARTRVVAAPGGDVYVRVGVERGIAPRGAGAAALALGDYAVLVVEGRGRDADDEGPVAATFDHGADELGMFTTLGIVRNAGGTIALAHGRGGVALRVYWPLDPAAASSQVPPSAAAVDQSKPHDTIGAVVDVGDAVRDASAGLAAWRDATIQRIVRTLVPVALLANVVIAVFSPDAFARTAPISVVCTALLCAPVVWPSMPSRWRAVVVLGGVVAVAGAIPLLGGFPPAAFALSATGVALAAALWGARGLAASAIVPVVSIVGAGLAIRAGIVEPLTLAFDPTVFSVWLRIAILMTFVLVVLSTLVVRTVEGLEAASDESRRAFAALQRQREVALAEQSAQVETARALAAADRADTVGRLAGSVAHDVNNALTVIGVWLQMLERPQTTVARVREGLGAIGEAVSQAVSVARQLAFDSAQLPLRAHRCDLRSAVMRTARTLEEVLPAHVAVTVDAEADAEVLVDPATVRQVVLNLALNARDAMPDGGQLTLRVAVEGAGRRAVLEVRDSGVGMTDEVAARAFEPFFTTKPAGAGTGLGLASVKRIVDATGGDLRLQTTPGVGTLVRMTWPMLARHTVVASEPTRSGRIDVAGARILLAEDEALVREGMADALRDAGCQVTTASDGDEAASLIEQGEQVFDLLCIDGIMPGLPTSDVIELCRERVPTAAILICSGHLPAELARRALPDSSVTVLLKPFSPDQLLAKISEVLAHAQVARDRAG